MRSKMISQSQMQFNSKQYINDVLNSGSGQLDFSRRNSDNYMNQNIFKYMNNAVKPYHNISTLELSSCKIDDKMMKKLSKGNWQNLTELFLYNNQLTSLSISHLKDGKWKDLKCLQIGKNPIKRLNGRTVLLSIPKGIEQINFCHLNLTNTFMRSIETNQWKELTSINFSYNHIKNAGIVSLIKCHWPKLQSLDLSGNHFTDDCGKVIRRGRWISLKNLTLRDMQLGIDFFEAISNNPWPLLQHINIRSKHFSQKQTNFNTQILLCSQISKTFLKWTYSNLTIHHFYPNLHINQHQELLQMLERNQGQIRIV